MSMLQRRFRIGYNRAFQTYRSDGRKSIVGHFDGSKAKTCTYIQGRIRGMNDL